jgi:hypothetical protein
MLRRFWNLTDCHRKCLSWLNVVSLQICCVMQAWACLIRQCRLIAAFAMTKGFICVLFSWLIAWLRYHRRQRDSKRLMTIMGILREWNANIRRHRKHNLNTENAQRIGPYDSNRSVWTAIHIVMVRTDGGSAFKIEGGMTLHVFEATSKSHFRCLVCELAERGILSPSGSDDSSVN